MGPFGIFVSCASARCSRPPAACKPVRVKAEFADEINSAGGSLRNHTDPQRRLLWVKGTMSWLDTIETIRKTDFTKATSKKRSDAAREVINMSSYACAMLSVSPVPFSDVALSLPLQTAMVVTLGHIHGKSLSTRKAQQLALELLATTSAGLLARQGIKALLPVVGAVLTIPAAFAANWALGRTALAYFESEDPSSERLKHIFESARQEGKRLFSLSRFLTFKRKNQTTPTDAKVPPKVRKRTRSTKVRQTKTP